MKKNGLLLIVSILFILVSVSCVNAQDPSTLQVSSNLNSVKNPVQSYNTVKSEDLVGENVISGIVKNCRTKKPFPGVNINVKDGGKLVTSTTTKKDGTYFTTFLSEHTNFNITASHTGHYSVTKQVVLKTTPDKRYGNADFELGNKIYVNGKTGNDNWDGTSPYYTTGKTGPKKSIKSGLSVSVSGGDLVIANGTYKDYNLIVKMNLNILGGSKTNTIINAHEKGLIFWIKPGYNVKIYNLTITDGTASGTVSGANGDNGGGIYNEGSLTVGNCLFVNNHASNGNNGAFSDSAGHGGYGGAIYNTNQGNLTVKLCDFIANRAGKGGNAYKGKFSFENSAAGGNGGAIYNQGILNLQYSNFIYNFAGFGGNGVSALDGSHGGYGGALYNSATSTINYCKFEKNRAGSGGYAAASDSGGAGYGGGIYNTGTLTVRHSSLVWNRAGKGGFSVNNQPPDGGNGGGVYNTGKITMSGCIIRNNHAGNGRDGLKVKVIHIYPGNGGDGGGFYNTGSLSIAYSDITGNVAGYGGYTIDTKHTPKTGGDGGAFYNTGSLSLSHSNIHLNFAGNGGLSKNKKSSNGGNGGAIYNKGSLNIVESEIKYNEAGKGRYNGINGNGGILYSNTGNTVSISFCRILNIRQKGIYLASSSANTVKLQNNWWGSNKEPKYQFAQTNISSYYSPWLVLRIIASPSSVYSNQASNVTADLIMNSNGDNTLKNYAMHVPDGIKGTFKAIFGTVNPKNGYTHFGAVKTVFTANRLSLPARVYAIVDRQVVSTAIQIKGSADTVIRKTVNNPRPNVGDKVTFTVTIKNNGPNMATKILIKDKLPSGFTNNVTKTSSGAYMLGIWTIPVLGNGATATMTMTGTVTDLIAGKTVTNIANKTSQTQYDPNPNNNNASASIYVPIADVYLGKTVDKNKPNVGDTVTFTVTAINDGPDTATNIKINDLMPNGFDNIIITPAVGTSYTNGVWTIPQLANGANSTLKLSGVVTPSIASQTVTNTATEISQDQYNPSPDNSASASIGVQEADIQITKNVDKQIANVGENVTFTIKITNNGPDSATNLQFIDKLLTGFRYVSANTTRGSLIHAFNYVYWNLGSLNNGESALLTIKATILRPGNITNIVRKTYEDQYDPDIDYATATVYAPQANISITNTASRKIINVGHKATFTIKIHNYGPDTATNIKIKDLSPSGFRANTTKGTYLNGVWSILSLKNGEEAVLTLTSIIGPKWAGKNIYNNVSETQNQYNSNPITSTTKIYVPLANMTILKVSKHVKFDPNDVVRFIIILENHGPNISTNIMVSDKLPTSLTFLSASDGGIFNPDSSIVTWKLDKLNPGLYNAFELETMIKNNVTSNFITNTATETQNEYNGKSSTSSNTIVLNKADLYLTGKSSQSRPLVGENFKVKFKLGNKGPDTARDVKVKITIPEGLKLTDTTCSQGNCYYDTDTRTVTWYMEYVTVGDPYLYLNMKAIKIGNYSIKPTVTTSTYDPNLQNSINTLNIQVLQNNNKNNNSSSGNTIGMQDTGTPFTGLLMSILAILTAITYTRKR